MINALLLFPCIDYFLIKENILKSFSQKEGEFGSFAFVPFQVQSREFIEIRPF
ncbi:MAG: hypothetical protein ACI9S8_000248 [Chlamydiales bacterium]|jgi:hypothetical protein